MAVLNGYCTVEDIREQLGDAGSRLDGSMIERKIEAASRRIDEFCGRKFWLDAAPVSKRYRPKNPDDLLINDVGSKTGLVVSMDDTFNGAFSTTWTIEDDFTLEPYNADIDRPNTHAWWVLVPTGSRTLPVGRRPTVRVTAQFGWSGVPEDIVAASILLASHILLRKDSPYGVTGMGEFGAVRFARLDPDVRALIQPYVRMHGVDL